MRDLKKEEIYCRAQIVKEKGYSLLLYKDARVDMAMLDEEFGAENWSNSYEKIGNSIFCEISVLTDGSWISKQDVGSETYTEAEKGQASDAFKRAGFRWGIGRELYTAPFIWIQAKKGEVYKRKDGKYSLDRKMKFHVSRIITDSGHIEDLEIKDQNNKVRFKMKGHVDNGKKEWLNESDKERWMKAEKWVKKPKNDPEKLRSKYKVRKADMDYFKELSDQAK